MAEAKNMVGLIGLGRWGKVLKSKLDAKGLEWEANGRNPAEYLPRLADTNWVFVATPTATHARYVEEALEAGSNVFCEKPFTLNQDEAARLYDLAGKKGLRIYVDDVFTWGDQLSKLRLYLSQQGMPAKLDFDWRKWGTFSNNLWGVLVYHDLTILDEVLGGLDSFEVHSCNINEYNRKEFLATANGFEVRLRYDRTQDKSIKPSKIVMADGRILYNSAQQRNDPLSEMIDAVLAGTADFEKNKRRTLVIETILARLIANYEIGIVPENLDAINGV